MLAEVETLAEAIPRIIQTICECLGWACGIHWQWDAKAQLLRCDNTWHVDAVEVAEFTAFSRQTTNEARAWLGEAPRTKTGGLVRGLRPALPFYFWVTYQDAAAGTPTAPTKHSKPSSAVTATLVDTFSQK